MHLWEAQSTKTGFQNNFFFCFRKSIEEKVKADCRESMDTWRILYEELYNKIKPFQVNPKLQIPVFLNFNGIKQPSWSIA